MLIERSLSLTSIDTAAVSVGTDQGSAPVVQGSVAAVVIGNVAIEVGAIADSCSRCSHSSMLDTVSGVWNGECPVTGAGGVEMGTSIIGASAASTGSMRTVLTGLTSDCGSCCANAAQPAL